MKRATRVVAMVCGIVVALAGLEDGIGEILQGLVFESWPESAFLEILSGEPAMSVVPNLLISGVVTVVLSIALIGWCLTGLKTVYGGTGLILPSFLLLIFAGGLGWLSRMGWKSAHAVCVTDKESSLPALRSGSSWEPISGVGRQGVSELRYLTSCVGLSSTRRC